MRKITVYYDGSIYVWKWLQPLIWSKKELKKLGYEIEFLRNPVIEVVEKQYLKQKIDYVKDLKSIRNKDIVFLAFHHRLSSFVSMPIEKRREILKAVKINCKSLVWLDCSDSTGTCMFDVLPCVDLYLKKQLFKDRKMYLQDYDGQRIYLDYYSKKYNLPTPEKESPISYVEDESYLQKLDISWNASLWNRECTAKFDVIKCILAIDTFKGETVKTPLPERSLTVFFNGQIPKESTAMSFQRKKTIEIIGSLSKETCYAPTERIPHGEYIKCLKDSVLSVSPFGYGEICNRDFEAFIYGNCLVKPTMEHLETFPDLYVENETYIPIDWDFSDLEKVIDEVESRKNMLEKEKIAKTAQERFLKYTHSAEKGRLFAEHLSSVLKNHSI